VHPECSRADNAVLKIVDFNLAKNLSGGGTVRPVAPRRHADARNARSPNESR
jgi:hypothetical protein